MSEGTIIGITFAISYSVVAVLLGLYMWYSNRENERYWERLYGKNDKKRKHKK